MFSNVCDSRNVGASTNYSKEKVFVLKVRFLPISRVSFSGFCPSLLFECWVIMHAFCHLIVLQKKFGNLIIVSVRIQI